MLRWARENGCHWNEQTCTAAAKGGHLNVLMWAIENGCPVSQAAFDSAAKSGRIDMLALAREVRGGLFWDDDLCTRAASESQFAALEWLLENGCPWRDCILAHIRDRLAKDPSCLTPKEMYPRILGLLRGTNRGSVCPNEGFLSDLVLIPSGDDADCESRGWRGGSIRMETMKYGQGRKLPQ